MRVAVVGGGNGGQSAAAHMTLNGHTVRLYDRFPAVLEAFCESRRLTVSGAVQGEVVLEGVSDDLEQTVAGADLVMVSVPGFALDDLALPLGSALAPGQVLVLHPGGTGGALRLKAIWDESGCGQGVVVAETETLVYAARLLSPGHPDVKAVKRSLSLATLPGSGAGRALELMQELYPQTRPATSVLETALANLNPVMHPPIVIGSTRAIETPGPRFEFYGDGISHSVAAVIDGLDAERVGLARQLGVPHLPLHGWVERAYAITAADTEALVRAMAASVYRGILGPDRMDSRYLSEDVPHGLVPWSQLGALAGAPTPLMDSVIELASAINRADYRAEGRTLERLGLGGLDAGEIVRRLGA